MTTTQTNGTGKWRGNRPTRFDDTFTVGQVSQFLRASHKTVADLIDTGKLRGYRLPGKRDRRVRRPELLQFLRENGMPVPPELGGACTFHILLIGPCRGVMAVLEQRRGLTACRCFPAGDLFHAGELSVFVTGDCAVVDASGGVGAAEIALAGLSRSQHWRGRGALVLGVEDGEERRLLRGDGLVQAILYPWSPADVAAAVCASCEGR